jgi:transcriptional regulator with XRE-family HTH domain
VRTLKEHRRQRGWSQQDLSEASGVGQDTISALERGHHEPRPSTLRKLARAFGVEVAELFRDPDLTPRRTEPLELEALYVADAAARHRALEAATAREREAYAARIDRVILDTLRGIPEWEDIAADESNSEGERRIAERQRDSLWRHIRLLADLRVEAVGEVEGPPQEERAEFIATHAGVGNAA